jgi:hypothetical protein
MPEPLPVEVDPLPLEVEPLLVEVGPLLAYPSTGDLSGAVAARLRLAPRSRAEPYAARLGAWLGFRQRPVRAPGAAWGRRPAWGLVAATLALLVLAGSAALALSPAARHAVAGWLGLRGVRITLDADGPLPSPRFQLLNLGDRVRLAEAQERVPFRILLPVGLEPDEVYVDEVVVPGGQVSAVYAEGPGVPKASLLGAGMLVSEFRGQIDRTPLQKEIQRGDTDVRSVTVNGGPGFWIEGRPHLVFFVDERGTPIAQTVRLAGNVLLWEQGGLTMRLESALSFERALAIAESLG